MKSLFIAIFAFVSIACVGQNKQFVPAAPYAVEILQPDGTSIKVLGIGDERSHFSVTEDGFTILKNLAGFYEYAELENGALEPSGVRVRNVAERTSDESRYLQSISKFQKPVEQESFLKSATDVSIQQNEFPSSGSRKILLLLIEYPDLGSSNAPSKFNSLMNQNNYGGTGSFRDYYLQASDGQLTLSVDVFGWYEAANSYDYYGDEQGDDRARELVAEAIDAAEAAGIDFSQYDNDGNGTVDNLMVAHSGPGAEEGSQLEYIWSHSWSLGYSYQRTYDGVTINSYTIQPETRSFGMVGIGVFCHEFGHALGLPDLYDTDDSNGDSEGLGNWCLMAGGPWLNNEKTPALLSAWTREELGWINPVTISAEGDYSLSPASTSTNCYKLLTPNSNEYFLLENRYKTGLDAALPGSGLAVFHINSNRSNNADENNKLADLEEADGLNHLDNNTNRGDGGDIFPGSTNNTSFNDLTVPNAQTYDSKLTGIDLTNIDLDGSTIRFTLGGGVEQGIDLTYNSGSNFLDINSTTVDVEMRVNNEGTQNSGAFNVGFYLSENSSVSTSDYLIGVKSVSSVNAGASVFLTLTKDVAEIVPEIPEGNYYVGYIIDYQSSVEELDEENNRFVFTPDQVQVVDLPNLTYVSELNSLGINGYDVTVNLTVRNNDNLASGICDIGYYASLNQSVTTSDYLIGKTTLPVLNPGETVAQNFSANVINEIPGLPEGEYYVGYIIDYQHVVDESNETDNSFLFSTETIDNILNPNLTYNSESNELEVLASLINLDLQVVSNGEKESENCRIGYYLSDDSNINTSDYLMGSYTVPGIETGQTSDQSASFDIASFEGDLDEGMYYAGYIIDYQNTIDELNENDNRFVFSEPFHYCPPDVTVISKVICEGDSVVFQDVVYTEDNVYEFVYESQTGCDSVIVLDITVNPVHNIELNEVICSGESFLLGDSSYSAPGIYTETFSNRFGCDSVVTLFLDVVEPIEVELNESICDGETFEMGGSNYSQTGTYIAHLTSFVGCDSTVTLNLVVNLPSDTLLTKTICEGDAVVVGDSVYFQTGVYTNLLKNRFGCDSLVTLDLIVNPSYESIDEKVICEGDTVWLQNEPCFETGIYIHTYSTILGCDSTFVLNLTVNPVYDTLLSLIVCEGEFVMVGNSVYNETGVYVENLTSRFGCDSIVTLDLIVNPVHETILEEELCEGDSIVVGSSVYKTTGSYTDVLANRFGCDSIVYLNLLVNPVQQVEIHERICEGSVYLLGNTEYSTSGVYTYTFSNRFGCDSTVTLYLDVIPLPVIDLGEDMTIFSSEVISLDAGAGFAEYLWNTGETTQTISVSDKKGLGEKSFSVTVTDNFLCSCSDEINITIFDDSMDESGDKPQFKLFPNPTSDGRVNLILENVIGEYKIQVVSNSGLLVYQEEFNSPGEKFVQSLILNRLTSGSYYIRLLSGEEVSSEQLVVVKN